MATTNDTETATSSPEENPTGTETQTPYLDAMAGLALAQQGQAQMDLEADRCLLRRDMKARQNAQYGLGQDNLPECAEDDMGVQVGDTDNSQVDNSKVIHNHYHGIDPDNPQPTPPVKPRFPWWLIVLLVVPWIILATGLVWWLAANSGGDSAQPVIWQLDIGAENPETIQPAGEPQ